MHCNIGKAGILFLLLLAVEMSLCAQPTNYIGYWPMDGNAEDIKNNNDGLIVGSTPTTNRFGIENTAYYFDGNDDYIEIASHELLQFGAGSFSISLWIYPENEYNVRLINTRGTGSGGSYKGYQIKIHSDGTDWYFHDLAIDDATGNYKYCSSCGSKYPFSEWYFITCVYEADQEICIYVNGEPDAVVTTGNYGDIGNTLPTVIGASIASQGEIDKPATISQLFKGKIDDIMLFDEALSPEQVNDLYTSQQTNSSVGVWSQYNDHIFHEGKVSIGTSEFRSDAVLTINGTAYAKQLEITNDIFAAGLINSGNIRVNTVVPCSDHVFNDDYNLMTLHELDAFIKANKHLPEVPSAKEYEENGYSVGEMDDLLLRKIEELTLYILHQETTINRLEKRIEELEK